MARGPWKKWKKLISTHSQRGQDVSHTGGGDLHGHIYIYFLPLNIILSKFLRAKQLPTQVCCLTSPNKPGFGRLAQEGEWKTA